MVLLLLLLLLLPPLQIAAVAAAAVMCKCECTVMHVEGNGGRNSGYIVSYVQRGESVQKTTAHRHSQHL